MVVNEFLLNQGFTFVDVETTGLEPTADRIIEIGILKVKNGRVVGKYHTLINPDRPIPQDSVRVSGISDEDVADAPKFSDVAEQLLRFFETGVVVAHNADFDFAFFQNEFANAGFAFSNSTLCTMELSKFFYPAQASHRLDMVAKLHGIKIQARHRALDDAKALHKLHDKLCEKFGEARVREVMVRLVQHRNTKPPALDLGQETLL